MSAPSLLEFEPLAEAGVARIAVDPAVRSPHPVSPLLYGKFCEHLGANIYRGMEAQVLYNPTFGKLKVEEGFFEHFGRRAAWPDTKALAESYKDGAAIGWFRLGSAADVRLSPEPGPHGQQAQRFETPGAAEKPTGIGQWTSLPLHRTRGYEYRVVARAAGTARLEIGFATLGAVDALELNDEWQTFTGRIDIPADAEVDPEGLHLFGLVTHAPANVVVDRVLLYPDDHVGHADPEIIRMLRQAKLPLLRWPGGNFVSGYHWRDGVGPVDARPTLPNPAWGGSLEFNLFGTDEFVAYCAAVGCEPMICVNAGNGTAAEAAAWLEYCNGSADTPMGRLRADNGHPEPYGVKYWEIGNEIFGQWQVGWTTAAGNVDRYRRFREALLAVDPSVRIMACGGLHLGLDAEWDVRLLQDLGDDADCHTHHILQGGRVEADVDPAELYHAFMAYPIRVGELYRRMRRRMLDAGIARPRIAITELQEFAHLPHPHGREPALRIPNPGAVSEALYFTLIANECIRLGDLVEMITHSATVNHGGGLRKLRERSWPNPVHHAHAMGMALAGGTPLAVKLACGTFSTGREFGHMPVVEAAANLDALAVLSADETSLLLTLVHRSANSGPIETTVDLGGLAAGGSAEVLTLAGEGFADENTYEAPERIVPVASAAEVTGGKLTLTLPPFSVTRVTVAL